MKPWLKRTLIGVFGASVLFGGLAACSHRGHHGAYGSHAMSEEDAAKMKTRMISMASSRLDLDEAQKAKLGVLVDKLRAQRHALVGANDPRTELQSLVAGPSFDRAKAQSFVAAKTSAITAQSPEVIAAIADFYDGLKPEQQAKVRELMERRGHRGWRG